MKQVIQRLANACGYRIESLPQPQPCENAFSALQHLLAEVSEPIIFDVGAHHGQTSREFRKLFPTSTIYAFEPFKESFELLRRNTASDTRTQAFNYGLSDREDLQSFHLNPSAATNSLLQTHELGSDVWGKGFLETREIVQAQFKTIDSVVAALQIRRIDLLKLDVQGAESLVMDGAAATCSRGMIRLIYSEIITQPTYKNQKRLDAALSSFYNNKFDLYNIYNMSLTAEGRLRQVDAIFTKTA